MILDAKPRLLDRVRQRLRLKHYSYCTAQQYVLWIGAITSTKTRCSQLKVAVRRAGVEKAACCDTLRHRRSPTGDSTAMYLAWNLRVTREIGGTAPPSYDGRAVFPASARTISYSSQTPLITPSSASSTGWPLS